MSTVARDRIRRCLAMIPLIRARPKIRIPELASIFGVREQEIWEDITEVLSLCGVPPYLPHNYLVFTIHGDQVSIRFAEHLARPVHLTLQEALAIDLALRSISGGRPPVFGDAASRLRRKLRELLAGREREALEAFDRSVGGTPPSELVADTIQRLKEGMRRNCGVRVDYYTASRDAVGTRVLAPYGLIDHLGSWYVIARDLRPGAAPGAVPFRVDRMRGAELVPEVEFEVPDDFTTEAFRRDAMWTGSRDDVAVEVRFSAAVAGRVREESDRRDIRELPHGAIVRRFRIQRDRPRWLYTHVARYGAEAEVLSPPEVRAGMARFLDGVLAHALPVPPEVVAAPGRGARSTAAASPRPARGAARARRKPTA
ncbi:MAG: helix-turn-helix transcriptional regulator [Planctomycetia bacterium]